MVLAIATAGLIYELGMAAVASYVMGDSVRQFSIVIGAYLSALGLGAYLTRYIEGRLAITFVHVELAAALVGGLSSPGLFLAFTLGGTFQLLLVIVVVAVGTLVGIELPLLMRILESKLTFKDLVARALTFDYAGALVGSLGFSLYLVPRFGLVETSIICGLLNAVVALGATFMFGGEDARERRALGRARWIAALILAALIATLFAAPKWISGAEARSYGRIEFARDTPYQRILLTEREGALELYLNGHLQFSERDECRYHEALVHPALAYTEGARRVLIGGGGDGLALREVLKWPAIERVVLVDLDPTMTLLARDHPRLAQLNRNSLSDPRVSVYNEDAFQWIEREQARYDVILLDFPDPTTYGVGKLFSTAFYAGLRKLLTKDGTIVVQATSPLLSPNSFWSIRRTVAAVGYHTLPYRVYLPSFGDWGFVAAKNVPFAAAPPIPSAIALSCLAADAAARLSEFPEDTRPTTTSVNRLTTQALVHTYIEESKRID